MTITIKRSKVTLEDFKRTIDGNSKATDSSGGRTTYYPVRLGPKNNNKLIVRFLTGPEGWVKYEQYWDNATRRTVIATEENEEQYAARNIKPSSVWLAAAVDVTQNRVIVVELKYTLVTAIGILINKYEHKFGPITSYDVELTRTGTTKDDIKYFALFDNDSELDLDRYEVPNGFEDWQSFLWNVIEKIAGVSDDDDSDNIEDDPVLNDPQPDKTARRVIRRK